MEKLLDMNCLWRMSKIIYLFILYFNHIEKKNVCLSYSMCGFDHDFIFDFFEIILPV